MVASHSLPSQWTWESTLVGTARPIQMLRNQAKTKTSNRAGRPGDVYQLWLGDFQSSPITNAVSVTNIITEVSGAVANATHTVYTFPVKSSGYGITANDRISVTGSLSSAWNIDYVQ